MGVRACIQHRITYCSQKLKFTYMSNSRETVKSILLNTMKLIKMKEGRKKGKERGREGLLCGRIYYFHEMSYAI